MDLVYFEDIAVGSTDRMAYHDVTEAEIIEFAAQWDPYPFHLDKAEAERTPFRGLTASSGHTFAIYLKLGHTGARGRPRWAVLAALGVRELSFPNPVRPGDRLEWASEVLSKRDSQSKPDRGVLDLSVTMVNQRDEPVMVLRQTMLIQKRGATR